MWSVPLLQLAFDWNNSQSLTVLNSGNSGTERGNKNGKMHERKSRSCVKNTDNKIVNWITRVKLH